MSRVPQVSVVMPAYNAARTIGVAVQSVLEQTHTDLELIVCDDGSNDHTASAVTAMADERVRVLENGANLGEGATRDRAIAAAKGHWIAVIDADDAWQPERLERMLAAAEGSMDRMIFDDILLCHDTGEAMAPWRRLRGDRAFGSSGTAARDITAASYIRSERLLIKPIIPRAFILEHKVRHSDRRFGADAEFFLRLISHGLGLRYVPQPDYLYRVTPGSATAAAMGGTYMRDCLRFCAGFDGFSPAEKQAFEVKIRQVEDYDVIRRIVRHLNCLEFRQALLVLVKRPRVLGRLPRLTGRKLAYQAHRILSGGYSH